MGRVGILLKGRRRPGENGGETVISGFREAFCFSGIDRYEALQADIIGLYSQFDGCSIMQALRQKAILPAPEVIAGADFQSLVLLIAEDEGEGQGVEAAGCSWCEYLPCRSSGAVGRNHKDLCPLPGQFRRTYGYVLFEGGAFFPAQVGGDPCMIGGIADILAQREFGTERKMSFAAEDCCSGFTENTHLVGDKQFILQIITAIMKIFQQGVAVLPDEQWSSGVVEVMLDQPVSGGVLDIVQVIIH